MPMFDDQQMCRCAQHAQQKFHSKSAPVHYPPDLSLEPVHLDIDLEVDPDTRSARGTVTTTVCAHVAGVRSIELDAVDFDIEEVADEAGEPLSHTYDGKKLRVTWDKPFDVAEERRVAITYEVRDPVAGLYFSHPTADYPDRPRWAATDHETERARYWLPCIDHLNVRTTLSFQLTADSGFTILANGASQETIARGTKKTAQWDLDFRCPSYLVCFALGEFTELVDEDFGSLPVAYYAAKNWSQAHLARSFDRTPQMLAWMTERLGRPFPFPKYYQFALPGIGGAMENISLVSWDDIFILDEDLAREWTWLADQVNVHEMAHSYFGDAVVCRDFSQVWLKESWATYMEQCWLEHRYGDDEKQYDFYRNAHAYFQEADGSYKRPMVTRTFDTSWDMYDRHLYPGGACRLHTLRCELGDEPFWRGVNAYLAENTGKVVETEDFRRAMERASGRSLTRFFDQWFYRVGYPDLKVEFSWDSEKSQGTFTVTQQHVPEDGAGDAPVFALELDLEWTTDGDTRLETVKVDGRKQYFRFGMAAEPTAVTVDPDGRVLHKQSFDPGAPKLRTQLSGGRTVLDRIRAAHTLSQTPRPKNVAAIAEAYASEPFWGVRQQFASALVAAGTAQAVGALAEIIRSEEDPMVIEYVLYKARAIRDPDIASAAQERADRGDLAPWAQGRAWTLLGRQAEPPIEQLQAAARQTGIHDIVQGAAIAALGATRRIEFIDDVTSLASAPGVEYRARAGAAATLGALGAVADPHQRHDFQQNLEELIRNAEPYVAKSAARALGTMGARGATEAIEGLAARLSHQEAVGLRRVIESIHADERQDVSALKAQISDLRAELRKVVERLEKVED